MRTRLAPRDLDPKVQSAAPYHWIILGAEHIKLSRNSDDHVVTEGKDGHPLLSLLNAAQHPDRLDISMLV